ARLLLESDRKNPRPPPNRKQRPGRLVKPPGREIARHYSHCLVCSSTTQLSLICTSTPAGSSSFMRASTVLSVGSTMSMSRLCVRSSYWSRASLSACGEIRMVYRSILVGSGTGPRTVAPVRLAVSTISRADLSINRWSNAFKRIRMFWFAIPTTPVKKSFAQLQNLRHYAGADGLAALANRKAQPLVHGNRADQLDRHLDVVPGHHHLHPGRQLDRARHVRGAKVKLRPVPLEERRVPPALLLRQHVHLALKVRVRGDAPGLGQHLAALDLFALRAPQEHPHVVPRLPLVEELAEHLHPRAHRLHRRPQPHDLH